MKDVPHALSYLKCIHCGKEYISCDPVDMHSKEVECPQCGRMGERIVWKLIDGKQER